MLGRRLVITFMNFSSKFSHQSKDAYKTEVTSSADYQNLYGIRSNFPNSTFSANTLNWNIAMVIDKLLLDQIPFKNNFKWKSNKLNCDRIMGSRTTWNDFRNVINAYIERTSAFRYRLQGVSAIRLETWKDFQSFLSYTTHSLFTNSAGNGTFPYVRCIMTFICESRKVIWSKKEVCTCICLSMVLRPFHF